SSAYCLNLISSVLRCCSANSSNVSMYCASTSRPSFPLSMLVDGCCSIRSAINCRSTVFRFGVPFCRPPLRSPGFDPPLAWLSAPYFLPFEHSLSPFWPIITVLRNWSRPARNQVVHALLRGRYVDERGHCR